MCQSLYTCNNYITSYDFCCMYVCSVVCACGRTTASAHCDYKVSRSRTTQLLHLLHSVCHLLCCIWMALLGLHDSGTDFLILSECSILSANSQMLTASVCRVKTMLPEEIMTKQGPMVSWRWASTLLLLLLLLCSSCSLWLFPWKIKQFSYRITIHLI